MERLSWIIQLDHKCNHRYSSERETKGDYIQRGRRIATILPQREERLYGSGYKTRKNIDSLVEAGRSKEQTLSPLEATGTCGPADTLILAN